MPPAVSIAQRPLPKTCIFTQTINCTMTKLSFLKWAVASLVLLNLGAIVFFFSQKHREGPRKTIEQRLHFDAGQISDYEKFITKHRRDVVRKEQEILGAKSELYRLLGGSDFSKKDSLVGRIGALQQEIEQVHFAHFQEIKSLCKGSQLADFEVLAGDLARLFSKKNENRN